MKTQNKKIKYRALSGGEAAAMAMRQINPEVVAVYPITPQTPIVEKFAEFVANGKVDTEMIHAESEHSAMSAAVGAAAAGVRAMTATSSQGLALMSEIVYVASGMRLPIVMHISARALSAPINIHCDHSDAMMVRDAGWIMLFSENAQEAYDNTFIALKAAETKNVETPAMVIQDGFITSHAVENVVLLDDEAVKNFIGKLNPTYSLLDAKKPVTYGALDLFDYYFEHKRQQIEGLESSREAIKKIDSEYARISGRKYDFIEEYQTKDAEFIIVVMGSTAGTAKVGADNLRKIGIKAGILKIRLFRPFPEKEIATALKGAKGVAVLDRSISYGTFGPLFIEVRSALFNLSKKPKMQNYIYGLGGRDIDENEIRNVFDDLMNGKIREDKIRYIGLRE